MNGLEPPAVVAVAVRGGNIGTDKSATRWSIEELMAMSTAEFDAFIKLSGLRTVSSMTEPNPPEEPDDGDTLPDEEDGDATPQEED